MYCRRIKFVGQLSFLKTAQSLPSSHCTVYNPELLEICVINTNSYLTNWQHLKWENKITQVRNFYNRKLSRCKVAYIFETLALFQNSWRLFICRPKLLWVLFILWFYVSITQFHMVSFEASQSLALNKLNLQVQIHSKSRTWKLPTMHEPNVNFLHSEP